MSSAFRGIERSFGAAKSSPPQHKTCAFLSFVPRRFLLWCFSSTFTIPFHCMALLRPFAGGRTLHADNSIVFNEKDLPGFRLLCLMFPSCLLPVVIVSLRQPLRQYISTSFGEDALQHQNMPCSMSFYSIAFSVKIDRDHA